MKSKPKLESDAQRVAFWFAVYLQLSSMAVQPVD